MQQQTTDQCPSQLPTAQAVAGGTSTAIVDYLGVTFKASDASALRPFIENLMKLWFGEVEIVEHKRGMWGYTTRLEVSGIGNVAYGGNADTCHIEIAGEGCAQVREWADVIASIEDMNGRLTRCDVAADDFDGARYNIAWAKEAYHDGGFDPERGTKPNAQLIDDMGSGKGCTLYVGSRESGKLFRCYEKGRQQGDKSSPWVRVEVEYRAVHRELPLQMLANPAAYLAGAYPCLAAVSVEQSRPLTVAYINAAMLERAVEHAKKQAGRILHALVTLNGGDIGAALARIYRPELPKRLKGVVRIMQQLQTDEGLYTSPPPDFVRDATAHELIQLNKASTLKTAHWGHQFNTPPAHALAA